MVLPLYLFFDIFSPTGPGHRPAENSVNVISFGKDDVPLCGGVWGARFLVLSLFE